MGRFAADMTEMLFAYAVSDPDPAEAHRCLAELVAADPSLVGEVPQPILRQFVAETGDPGAAAAVARSVPLTDETLNAFLLRSDLPLSDIEPFIPGPRNAAHVLASQSDRPDVLELVFADPETRSDDAVLTALITNVASPTDLRVQATAERLSMGMGPYGWTQSVGAVLRQHPEIQQPVFDALDLPGDEMLQVFMTLSSWTELNAAQLGRLIAAFEQQQAVLNRHPDAAQARGLASNLALLLLRHPATSPALQGRLVAALPAGLSSKLETAVGVLTAPDRLAALVAAEDEFYGSVHVEQFVLETAPPAELAEALAVLRDSAEPLQRFAAMVVCWLPRSRYTPDLLAALPSAAFRDWVRQNPLWNQPGSELTELLVSRAGTDPAVWRTFIDLAEVADADVTVGDVIDLAASLSAAPDEHQRRTGT